MLKLPLLLAAGPTLTQVPRGAAEQSRWSPDRANRWYQAQGWLVGANYITSNAINQLEMFQADTFDPRRIDTEPAGRGCTGSTRCGSPARSAVGPRQPRLPTTLAQFVTIAARHRIKPLFVLFDSCWDPFPKPGRQRAPKPGVHNSGWVQSPGAEHLDDLDYRRTLLNYVTEVLTQFRTDDRVLGWDLWNEPDNPARAYRKVERKDKLERVADLLSLAFGWARSVDPSQPITSGVWDGEWGDPQRRSEITNIQLDNSDVVTFHCYDEPAAFEARITELFPLGRPILCTEYLARTLGSTVGGVLPVAKRHNVGAINWGWVAGKTQTYFPWDSWDHPYTTAPKLWFQDVVNPMESPTGQEIQTLKLTRRERPATTTADFVDIDHRRAAAIAPGDLIEYLRAAMQQTPGLNIYIESVHRLSDRGAVVIHAADGTSREGFNAEWREVSLVTADGDTVNRCELFDEADLDDALARFDEIHPQAPD